MGFFETAARRSKRGYRGELHRCNDTGEVARVLSRDLNGISDGDRISAEYRTKSGEYNTIKEVLIHSSLLEQISSQN